MSRAPRHRRPMRSPKQFAASSPTSSRRARRSKPCTACASSPMKGISAAFVALSLAGASCAVSPPSPRGFVFGVMGDTPYNDREEPRFVEMIRRMDAEPLAFAIHVGDIKAGSGARCSDALYARRLAQFNASAHPLIYTPGDNEWTDCRRRSNGADDPLERLARIRD